VLVVFGVSVVSDVNGSGAEIVLVLNLKKSIYVVILLLLGLTSHVQPEGIEGFVCAIPPTTKPMATQKIKIVTRVENCWKLISSCRWFVQANQYKQTERRDDMIPCLEPMDVPYGSNFRYNVKKCRRSTRHIHTQTYITTQALLRTERNNFFGNTTSTYHTSRLALELASLSDV
jgi:hypothetical protein